MSYSTIITFKDGKPDVYQEFNNSWGGGARIWKTLYDKYLKDTAKEYSNFLDPDNMKRLWLLARRQDLPMFERAVLTATFDHAIITKNHFKLYAEHLKEFVIAYRDYSASRCILNDWRGTVELCEAEAVGFQMTSVCEDMWEDWDEKLDEGIPYDLNTGDKHFEVYDWLNEIKEAEEK